MGRFTVVCPIHDEALFLPITLPYLYGLYPYEVVFLLDRCTDSSFRLCYEAAKRYPRSNTRIHIYTQLNKKYASQLAYLTREGIDLALTNRILITNADIILDRRIAKHIEALDEYELITFGYLEKSVQTLSRFMLSALSGRSYGGIYAVSKEAAMLEDREKVKTLTSGDDSHLQDSVTKKKHFNTGTIHLRPRENRANHYLRGRELWLHPTRTNPVEVFARSVLLCKPAFFAGYWAARPRKK